jgi:hypothetical protein
MHIFVLKPLHRKLPTGQLQHHCQGNTIAVPQDPAKAVKAKYLSFDEFVDLIMFFWVGDKIPPKSALKKWCNVNRSKLVAVAKFWKVTNVVRRAMDVPDFSDFPEDDVPDSIYTHIKLVKDKDFKMSQDHGAPLHEADVIRSMLRYGWDAIGVG